MTTFALSLILCQPQAKITYDPNLKANYHIDRSEQTLHRESRLITIPAPKDGWSGALVTLKFTAPLGMKESELPESRNFSAQQVHSLRIYRPGGKNLRFVDAKAVKSLTPADHGFWTLENGQLTGHSVVAIRLESPGKGSKAEMKVQYDLCKTDIREKVVDGADPGGYKTLLSDRARSVGLEPTENGYTVDADALVKLFQSRGMVAPNFRVSDLLVQMLKYAGTLTYDKDAIAVQNVNTFFEVPAKATGDCHVSTQFGLGGRVFGVPAFKVSGIYNGSDVGHAISRFYDAQLGDSVSVDFSYVAAGPKGVNLSSPHQFPTGANLTYLLLDHGERMVAGISGIEGDIQSRGVRFGTKFRALAWDGKTFISESWPAYIEGSAKTVPLKPTDPGYVVFKTGVGPTFPNGRPQIRPLQTWRLGTQLSRFACSP